MPLYFGNIKIKSFQRQLNMWGFERVCNGPDRGAYTHEWFERGNPDLCHHMRRIKVKGTGHMHHGQGHCHDRQRSISPVPSTSVGGCGTTNAAVTDVGVCGSSIESGYYDDQGMYHQMYGPYADPVSAAALAWTSSGHVQPLDLGPSVNDQHYDSSNLTAELESMKNRLDTALSRATIPEWNNNCDGQQQMLSNTPSSTSSVLHEGDCIFFEGRNFFFVGDESRKRQWLYGRAGREKQEESSSKTTSNLIYQPEPPTPLSAGELANDTTYCGGGGGANSTGNYLSDNPPPPRRDPTGRRISKRFSLELDGSRSDSQNFVLKELMDMQFDLDGDNYIYDDTHNGIGPLVQHQQSQARRLSKRYSMEPNPVYANNRAYNGGGAEQMPSHIFKELLDLDLEGNGNDDEDRRNNISGDQLQQRLPYTPQHDPGELPETEQAPTIPQYETQDQIIIDLPTMSNGKRFSLLSRPLNIDDAILGSLGSLNLGDL
jgi:hypothetical protein